MSHLYVTVDPAASPTPLTGYVNIRKTDATSATQQALPPGVSAVDRYPQILKYRKRTYIIGTFTRLLVRDEFGNLRAGGIKSPVTVPTLADGGLAASSTGNMIGYQTFLVKHGGKVFQQSNPGPASATLAAAGTGRAWGNLDTTPQDSHVTHMRGWVSVDGSVPALAWERPLPATTTTVSENVATGALSETLPVKVSLAGSVDVDPFARGVPPYCQYAEEYHNAFFYAGDPAHPERIYPSKIFEPESVNTTPITINGRTEEPWLSTTDGSPVTGIKRQGDELIVGTLRGIDAIQGYSAGDYSIRRISNFWGVLSHWSMRRCGPSSSLWFAAPQGITRYLSGSFAYVGWPIETWWRDNYRDTPELFERCYAAEDRFTRCYKLLIPEAADAGTTYLNFDYIAAEAGQPIMWFHRRDRIDKVIGELLIDGSANYFDLYTGSCDGYVRKENVATNGDDDGDTYGKKLTVQFPHRFFGDQGGDDAHGRTVQAVDIFIKHPNNAMEVSVFAGDDDAPTAATPQYGPKSFPATGPATGRREKVKRTSEHISTEGAGVSGKGVTLLVEVQSPVEVEIRGWGCELLPGPQTQPWK